jgi:hypothetical protein
MTIRPLRDRLTILGQLGQHLSAVHDQLGPQLDQLSRSERRVKSSFATHSQEPTFTTLDVATSLFPQSSEDTTVQLPTLRHSQTSNVIVRGPENSLSLVSGLVNSTAPQKLHRSPYSGLPIARTKPSGTPKERTHACRSWTGYGNR